MNILDPIQFQERFWPNVTLYDKQKEILYSLRDNDETIVPAGNALGKDFVSAFAALWFFLSRNPVRIVTSSVDVYQLRGVLWGEIKRFLQTSVIKLPVELTDLRLRKIMDDGTIDPLSYLIGRVAAKGEGMLGHHIARENDGVPKTLMIFDEASGVSNELYENSDTWAHRKLIIGNPYPCNNFFFKGVTAGNLKSKIADNLYRNVIKITAEDSPNVRFAEAQIANGKPVTEEILIPGVKEYSTYVKHRELWDDVRQCVGLDAEFYLGAEILLYPPIWLDNAQKYKVGENARTIGCDPAEGGDNTCWAVTGEEGIIEMVSMKTPDTTIIPSKTISLMRRYNVESKNVWFDRGGGGKQHVDRLRNQGYKVNTVAFGEPITLDIKRGMESLANKKEHVEERYVYKNRRAEMYGMLRERLDPSGAYQFGIPKKYEELRRQLRCFPLLYDGEGRMYLPPKNRRNRVSTEETLVELIGCSPDESDALVIAVYGMDRKQSRNRAGAVV